MVSRLLDREAWSGPLGVARIAGLVSATWVFFWGLASVVGLTAYSYKIYFPMTIMLVSLAFLGGYQMGHVKRP
jgi:hypothetical protein